MIKTLTQIFVSLAVVLTAYIAYAMIAVPLIEPEVKHNQVQRVANHHNPLDRWQKLLKTHFGENSWVLNYPKVLQMEHGLILIKEYKIRDKGRMDLTPFAMVFFPSDDVQNDPQRASEAIILEAPSATLQFDGDVDLRRAKIGRLKSGRLIGEVTIRSDQKLPGPEDDLLIRTRNVQLKESEIWTAANVDFRLGSNFGSGREMHIELQSKKDDQPSATTLGLKTSGLKIGGMKNFRLLHDVKMQIQMTGKGLLPSAKSDIKETTESKKTLNLAKKNKPQTPVTIACDGPFQFDMQNQVARFQEHVFVQRLHPHGKHDQLTCEILEVFFSSKQKKADDKNHPKKSLSNTNSFGKLHATAIKAVGNPVIVQSPSTGASAKCQQLDYQLDSQKITLQDKKIAILKDPQREMHAPLVTYQPGKKGSLGIVYSEGPGWLSGRMKENEPDSGFYAQWGKQLSIQPKDGQQLLSILGGGVLQIQNTQRLSADEIWFWMKETPKIKNTKDVKLKSKQFPSKDGIVPDRLIAIGNVIINSVDVTANTKRLEVWFQQRQTAASKISANQQSPPDNATGKPVNKDPNNSSNNPSKQKKKSSSHYKIRGDLVRINVLQQGQQTSTQGVQVVGNVEVTEIQNQPSPEKPLLIRGQELTVRNADSDHAMIIISGNKHRWAYLEIRGLTLSGQQIVLDRKTNKMWIPGPGKMTLPMDRDLEGNPIARPQQVAITWKKRMDFDGRAVVFRDGVEVRGETELIRTAMLEAQFAQRIDFAKPPKHREKNELSKLICRGDVFVENRTLEKGILVSTEYLSVKDLSINQKTGAIFATGPGWVKMIKVGEIRNFNLAANRNKNKQGKNNPSKKKIGLNYLLVKFEKQITGNLHQKVLVFTDQIKTVYGPVKKWTDNLDPEKPELLGDSGVTMNCQRLTVTQIPDAKNSKRGTIDMAAEINTLVENPTYTARAHRITFSQAKDLLILEGSGRTDAQLWHQATVGGPVIREAARKILYWRGSNRVELDDVRYFNLNRSNLNEANRTTKPSKR